MGVNIIVVGDTILDEFKYVKHVGPASHYPMEIYEEGNTNQYLGGAANVVNHLQHILKNNPGYKDIRISFHTAYRHTPPMPRMMDEVFHGINLYNTYREKTPVKTRIIVPGQEQPYKLQFNQFCTTNRVSCNIADISLSLSQSDLNILVIANYNCGLLTNKVSIELHELVERARKYNYNIYTIANTQSRNPEDITDYDWVDLLLMNENEFNRVMGREPNGRANIGNDDFETLYTNLYGDNLSHDTAFIVTVGDRGAYHWWCRTRTLYPSEPVTVVDDIGAGDAFLAAFVLCITNSNPDSNMIALAMKYANYYAGLSVTTTELNLPRWERNTNVFQWAY